MIRQWCSIVMCFVCLGACASSGETWPELSSVPVRAVSTQDTDSIKKDLQQSADTLLQQSQQLQQQIAREKVSS